MHHTAPEAAAHGGLPTSSHGVLRPSVLTAHQWEVLQERQRILEEEATSKGGERFRKRVDQAIKQGDGSTVGAAATLLRKAFEPVEGGLQAIVDLSESTRGPKHVAYKWIKMVGIEETAYIVTRTVLDHIHQDITLHHLARKIFIRLRDEMQYRRFQVLSPRLFEYKMNAFDTSNYAHMSRSLSVAVGRGICQECMKGVNFKDKGPDSERCPHFDMSDLDLPDSGVLALGSKMIDVVATTTGLVTFRKDTVIKRGKKRGMKKDTWQVVAAEQGTSEYLEKRNDHLEFLHPVKMPMVVPPLAWGPGSPGGYRYALWGTSSFIRGASKAHEKELLGASMPLVYEAVNRIQETAYRINPHVLRVLEEIEAAGGGRAKVPSLNPIATLPRLQKEWKTKEERKADPEYQEWRKAAAEVHSKNYTRVKEGALFLRIMRACQEVKDEAAIWFPHNVDFRGRVYPISDTLSPQGDDLQKGLLQFAEGKPLGPSGAAYLAIHGANVMGKAPFDAPEAHGKKVSKWTLQERVDWIEAHTLEILAVTQDPLGVEWWQGADEPIQFLAFCFDWAAYYDLYQQGRGEEYESALVVSSDGTCNGLQHFAALFRDPVGAEAVNVVPAPSGRPQDVYDKVAQIVTEMMREEVKTEPLAALWLASGLIDRSLVKTNVMTFGYGSKVFGFKDQLMEKTFKKWSRSKGDPMDYAEIREYFTLPGEDRSQLEAAVSYLARQIWNALKHTAGKAQEAMAWLQGCARNVAKGGDPVEWVVPMTGFRVVQPYFQRKSQPIRTVLLGVLCRPTSYEQTSLAEPYKQGNAMAPNVVHSLDAAALMLTVTAAAREQDGMSFTMVHDSYGTHAADAELLAGITRECFHSLYTEQDVVSFLRDQWIMQSASPEKMPQPPERGTLDLSQVHASPYFFC